MGTQQTSSSTVEDIVGKARGILNDISTPYYFLETSNEVIGWCQDALLKVARHSHGPQETEDINLLADTLEYTITSNYVDVEAVLYINSSGTKKALIEGHPRSVGQVEDVNEPVYWYDWDGQLGIFPTLSAVTTQKVTAYLISRPSVTLMTDSITTPAIYDTCLALYIAAMAKFKDAKYSSAAQLMGMCERELYKERIEVNA